MEDSFPFLIGAIAPVLFEAIRQVGRWVQQWRGRRQTEEQAFYAAMETLDFKTIGRFLDRNIGALDFETYSADPTVRRRVDTYLVRIARFLEQPPTDQRPVKGTDVKS